MTMPPDPDHDSVLPKWHDAAVMMLTATLVLSILPELVLQGADHGLWGDTRWRQIAYANAGFWAGLLHDWQPNFSWQPLAMFFTYGFLHAGSVHLILNMLTLIGLGRVVAQRAGALRFALIYGAAMFGGAAGFAALSTVAQPMVGASGALFGLAGALSWWEFRDRTPGMSGLWPVARSIIGLIILNLVMWWAMDGLLAWQTHLGGFLSGGLAAAIGDRTARKP